LQKFILKFPFNTQQIVFLYIVIFSFYLFLCYQPFCPVYDSSKISILPDAKTLRYFSDNTENKFFSSRIKALKTQIMRQQGYWSQPVKEQEFQPIQVDSTLPFCLLYKFWTCLASSHKPILCNKYHYIYISSLYTLFNLAS
jgi:hypothetical protein